MSDPFMKADMGTALASAQFLFAHVQAGDYKNYWQSVALCATTDLNFLSQTLLKDSAILGKEPEQLAHEAFDADHIDGMKKRLAMYEKIKVGVDEETKLAKAAPAGQPQPVGSMLSVLLAPLINAVIAAIKLWLANILNPPAPAKEAE